MHNSKQNKRKETSHHGQSPKILSRTTMANMARSRLYDHAMRTNDYMKDRELMRRGLNKLISSLNSTNKVGRRAASASPNRKESISLNEGRRLPRVHSATTMRKYISMDKCQMTDLPDKRRKIDLANSALSQEPIYRDPRWTDPRLLRKYDIVPCKKPLDKLYLLEQEADSDIESSDYEDAQSLFHENRNNIFFRCICFFNTTSASFVGFMCGITVLSVIFWRLIVKNMITFYQGEENYVYFPITKYVLSLVEIAVGRLAQAFGTFLERLGHLLMLSTSDVYAIEETTDIFCRHQ